jgi:hypothetical protein
VFAERGSEKEISRGMDGWLVGWGGGEGLGGGAGEEVDGVEARSRGWERVRNPSG